MHDELDENLVAGWIDFQVNGGNPSVDPVGFANWSRLSDMAHTDTFRLWRLVMALVDRNDEKKCDLIPEIAAGPFEDLLAGIASPLSEFFFREEYRYVDRLLPHIIYPLLETPKKEWLDRRKLTSGSKSIN